MTASPWPTRVATLVLAAALAASVAWWVPRLAAPRPAIAPVPAAGGDLPVAPSAGARLFGVAPEAVAAAPPSALAGVQVVGLVSGPRGSAVLAIEGQPVRSFAVGEEVRPGWKLAALDSERVVIASEGGRLELPGPPRPTLAVLTAAADRPRGGTAPGSEPAATSEATVTVPPQRNGPAASAPGIPEPAEGAGPEPAGNVASSPGLPPTAGGALPGRAGAVR